MLPASSAEPIVSLASLRAGQKARVESLAGRGLHNKLVALGFMPGEEVTMVQNFGRGPIIVVIRDTRVALGRGEAIQITVRRD